MCFPFMCFMCLCRSSGHAALGGRGEDPPCCCRPDPGHTCLPRPQQAQPQRAAHTETGYNQHLNIHVHTHSAIRHPQTICICLHANLKVAILNTILFYHHPTVPPYSLTSPLSFLHKRLLVEMEGFKQQVMAVQQCQSALRLPEEVVASLPICRTAQTLQQEASQLQHTTIQQCNILQVEGSPCIANAVNQLSHIRSN